MDIPSLVTSFSTDDNKSLLDSILKNITIENKDREKDLLSVFLILDLDKERIRFDAEPYSEEYSCQKYNYFGNNDGNQTQFYIVRDCDSMINFWSASKIGILQCLLKSLKIEEGELKKLLEEASDKELFSDQGLNIEKIDYKAEKKINVYYKRNDKDKSLYIKKDDIEDKQSCSEKSSVEIESDGTEFSSSEENNGEKCNSEKFLQYCLDITASSKPILIVPQIYKDNQIITISNHPDYITLVESFLQGSGSGQKAICHICGKEKMDINTKEYSTKFNRNGIGKIFVTTPVNYAPSFTKQFYDKNYSICADCYNKYMLGEKVILDQFNISIAKEKVILLFEGIDKKLDKSMLDGFTKKIDMAFNPNKIKTDLEKLNLELEESNLYEFNIIFYKSDGKFCTIKKAIESVSNIRFNYVNDTFENIRKQYFSVDLKYFMIGHLYNMIPVNTAKDGTQLNIGRLLNLYSAVIKNEMIEKNYIFELALEALEKGYNELRSSKLRNYKNLYSLEKLYNLQKSSGDSYGIDRFIKKIIFYYIAFFHVVSKFKMIDKEVFNMQNDRTIDENLPQSIKEMEQFLNEQGFKNEACGLFYIGTLVYQVGVAQAKQNHKLKPILDKIQYTGMSKNDVLDLYSDLWEKRQQYQKYINLYIWEYLEKQVHVYIGNPEKNLLFTERENVFYIMSGYAFSVGRYKKDNKDGNKEIIEDGVSE